MTLKLRGIVAATHTPFAAYGRLNRARSRRKRNTWSAPASPP